MSNLLWKMMAEFRLRGYWFNLRPNVEKKHAFRKDILDVVLLKHGHSLLSRAAATEQAPVARDDSGDRIFSLWLQGEENAPPLVKACFRSVRHNCRQPLVVLDEKTLTDYIDLPDTIMDKYRRGNIYHAHFADIVRVELLYRHGGYWLDTTCFVTEPIPKVISEADFFVFMSGENINPETLIQNCFIRARKGAYLLAAWRAMIIEYWLNAPKSITYFQHQHMFKLMVREEPRAAALFSAMPHLPQDATHALWWSESIEKPFDRAEFERLTAGAFFQKTTYRSPYAIDPPPGSMADEMINRMYL